MNFSGTGCFGVGIQEHFNLGGAVQGKVIYKDVPKALERWHASGIELFAENGKMQNQEVQNMDLYILRKWQVSMLITSRDHASVQMNVDHFLEDIRLSAQKKNLIPLLFNVDVNEVGNILAENSESKECKEAVDGLLRSHEFKFKANEGNWRLGVAKTDWIFKEKYESPDIVMALVGNKADLQEKTRSSINVTAVVDNPLADSLSDFV
ncbi:P-loop containing nucleoside triphosphate hydrolase superfamily protein [Tanacetum coccineum]